MRTSFLVLVNLIIPLFYGQLDSINQFDRNGKKHGYWTRYLDSNLNPIDSSQSYFYGFEYFDEGKVVFKFNKHRFRKKFRHSFIDNSMTRGRPRVLDGSYFWFEDNDSLPDFIETYKHGRPVTFIYYRQKCNHFPRIIHEYVDFTRTYNNIVGSYYYEFWAGSDKLWFRKVDDKWKFIKID
jgi:hypothetical protein